MPTYNAETPIDISDGYANVGYGSVTYSGGIRWRNLQTQKSRRNARSSPKHASRPLQAKAETIRVKAHNKAENIRRKADAKSQTCHRQRRSPCRKNRRHRPRRNRTQNQTRRAWQAKAAPAWLDHAIATPLALAAGIVLICLAHGTGLKWACAVFMTCSLVLFGNSACYHLGDWSPRVTDVLRRIDHMNIFC